MNLTLITLSAVLRESIAQLIPLAIKRNIDIDIALEECNVIADETLLLSLCRNILENAIRHTPDGGVVSVSLQHSEQHIIMTIIDDGTGIDPHYLGQMTNRFSQSGRGDEGAAGLGLALVAEIAAWHQLELSLQNHPQRGLMVQVKWSKF